MSSTHHDQTTGSSFTALTRQVHDLGLMRRRYAYYWSRLVGAVVAMAAWVLAVVWIGDSWWQLAPAAVLAVLMTQIAFLGHDAAHRQMFRSGRLNDWVSLIVANLLVGISYGWWQSKHTRHHGNPNKVGHDPDIAPGVLAFTPEQAHRSHRPLVRWLVVAAEPVTSVDVTAADVLSELDDALHAVGIELCFAEMKDPVKDKLKRFGLFARLGEQTFFTTIDEAVIAYRESHALDEND